MGLSLADRRRQERMAIDEARAKRAPGYIDEPVKPEESIPRLLGAELIDAARMAVRAYHANDKRRLGYAVYWLTRLVGGEP